MPRPHGNLRAPLQKQIQGGEVLEQPDWADRAEHRHGTAQPDVASASSSCGEYYCGRCIDVVGAMVFAEIIATDVVGEHDFVEQSRQPLHCGYAVA